MNNHSEFRTTTLKPVNYANMKKQLRALVAAGAPHSLYYDGEKCIITAEPLTCYEIAAADNILPGDDIAALARRASDEIADWLYKAANVTCNPLSYYMEKKEQATNPAAIAFYNRQMKTWKSAALMFPKLSPFTYGPLFLQELICNIYHALRRLTTAEDIQAIEALDSINWDSTPAECLALIEKAVEAVPGALSFHLPGGATIQQYILDVKQNLHI